MKNQEKFSTRSSKLKEHRTLAKDIVSRQIIRRYCLQQHFLLFSCLVSFAFIFSSLICFAFCLCVCVFFKQRIYILIPIRLCRRLCDKKNFTRPSSGNKTNFVLAQYFVRYLKYTRAQLQIVAWGGQVKIRTFFVP